MEQKREAWGKAPKLRRLRQNSGCQTFRRAKNPEFDHLSGFWCRWSGMVGGLGDACSGSERLDKAKRGEQDSVEDARQRESSAKSGGLPTSPCELSASSCQFSSRCAIRSCRFWWQLRWPGAGPKRPFRQVPRSRWHRAGFYTGPSRSFGNYIGKRAASGRQLSHDPVQANHAGFLIL